MSEYLSIIIPAVVLSASCSLDAFTAAFAYGSSKIKIPFLSNQIINLICSSFLGLSLWAGSFLVSYIPNGVAIWLSFTILFLLGIIKILDGVTKAIIKKHTNFEKQLEFSAFNLKFILHLYANPEAADQDRSRSISVSEATLLAFSLSFDSIAAGFGAGLSELNIGAVVISSYLINMIAITLGGIFGNKLAQKSSFNPSWLGGAILIVLAIMRIA